MSPFSRVLPIGCALLAVLALSGAPADAQTPSPAATEPAATPAAPAAAAPAATGTGTIEGRVKNARNGKFLDKAVVSVDGSKLQALTDESGQYILFGVPVGTASVTVNYTGQAPIKEIVDVVPGKVVNHDFTFNPSSVKSVSANGAMVLDEFVIQAEKEQNAQEIAINEQRNSPNIKNVVAADSFGDVMSGNIADFVKYIPGITVDYSSEISTYGTANDAQRISVRGVPSNLIPIMVDGMPVADANVSLSRTSEMEQLSINNASRVEVIDQPTPDLPFGSPGGVINLISKSAFEYANPQTDVTLYATTNNEDLAVLHKEPGPHNKKTYHTLPGFTFSYIRPITKTFGITVSGLSNNEYDVDEASRSDWTYTGVGTYANPYFNRIRFISSPRDAYRESASVKLDWKPSPANTISMAYSASYFDGFDVSRTLDFNKLTPTGSLATNYGPTFTNSSSTSIANDGDFQDKTGLGQNLNLIWRLRRGPWQVDTSASYSNSSTHLDSGKDGYVSDYSMNLSGVKTTNVSGIVNGVPNSIQTLNSAGAPIDYTQLSNFSMPSSFSMGSTAGKEVLEAAKVDVRRDFDFLPFRWMDLAAKTGFYVTRDRHEQYGAGESPTWNLVTAAEPPGFSINSLLDTVNTGFQHHFAVAGNAQFIDPFLMYQFFINNPGLYASNDAGNWHTYVNNNKDITEVDGQYYGMLDASFLKNRLRVIAGVRAEKEESTGHVPYSDPGAAYEQNPDGSYVLVNGARVLVPNLTTLQEYQLIYRPLVYQATHETTKPNDTVNVSYNILTDLIGQVNYSKTYGKQNFNSLTQANGSNPTITELAPGSTNADGSIGTVTIPNPGLPPEISNNWDYKLSYYTKTGGVISANYYRKSITNYVYTTTTLITPSNLSTLPGDLSINPSDYLNYDLITTSIDPNTTVHQSGWEFAVTQNLSFIPYGGQYFNVFGNYTTKSQSGIPLNADASTPNGIASTSAAGVIFSRKGITIGMRMVGTAEQVTTHSSATIAGVTTYWYDAIPSARRYDLNTSWQITQRWAVFANARNVFNEHQKTIMFGPGFPTYSFPENNYDFGVTLNIGVKAHF